MNIIIIIINTEGKKAFCSFNFFTKCMMLNTKIKALLVSEKAHIMYVSQHEEK